MAGEFPVVTVFASGEASSTFHFPKPTRMILPCTSSSTCYNIGGDVIFMSQEGQDGVLIMARLEEAIGLMELQRFSRLKKKKQSSLCRT